MSKRIYIHAFASVRFMAPQLDPLDITKAIRLPPDLQFRCGEPRIKRSAKGVVDESGLHRFGLWSMSSELWVDSPKLQTHVIWLLGQLEPHAQVLSSLAIEGLEIDIFCYSVGATPSPPSISRSITERAEKLGISIGVDHYNSSGNETDA